MASAIRIGGKQASYDKRRTSLEGAEWQGYIYQGGNAYGGGTGDNYYTDSEMKTKLTDEERREKNAEKSRKYYQENKNKVLETNRKYIQKNKERIRERDRKYYQEKRDVIKILSQNRYSKNKDILCENMRKHYQKIREEKQFAETLQMMTAVGQITELQTT